MTKTEAVQVNLIYLIFKLVHFLVDTSGLIYKIVCTRICCQLDQLFNFYGFLYIGHDYDSYRFSL